jgi:hypothetical protein
MRWNELMASWPEADAHALAHDLRAGLGGVCTALLLVAARRDPVDVLVALTRGEDLLLAGHRTLRAALAPIPTANGHHTATDSRPCVTWQPLASTTDSTTLHESVGQAVTAARGLGDAVARDDDLLSVALALEATRFKVLTARHHAELLVHSGNA